MDAVECWYHYFLDRQAYNNFAAYLFLAHIGSILTPSLFQPGCYPPRPGRGSKPLFNSSQKAQIKEWDKQEPRQLKNVSQKVQETWSITPSTKTIKRILKTLNMSWHRMRS